MKYTILLFFSLLLLSCSTRKQIVLYQDIDDREFTPIEGIITHPKIQIGDMLHINIATANIESLLPFSFSANENFINRPMTPMLSKLSGYLVNSDGDITFPQLGKINVLGKTTQEIQTLVEEKISRYIKEPTVLVRLVNFKFTIQGEVSRPGTFEIFEENMTLPQALGQAGDLTIRGKRDNVLIYRQEGGERRVKRIDLTKTDWMDTEYFYVRPNDIIYVEPNQPRIKSAGFIGNVGTIISVISFSITLILILTR